MSDLDDDELRETKRFYAGNYYNKNEEQVIKDFKKRIERSYEDIINMEVIETYCLQYDLTEEEKNILIRRFL